MTTQTTPDVGMSDGCGDGVPEDGVYCFVEHEVPDLVNPADWTVADLDDDGHPELALNLVGGGTVVARWNEAFEILVQDSPSHGPFLARPRAGGPLEFVGSGGVGSVRRVWLDAPELRFASTAIPSMTTHDAEHVIGVMDVDGENGDEVLASMWGDNTQGWVGQAYSLVGQAWLPTGPTIAYAHPPAPGNSVVADIDGDARVEAVMSISEGDDRNYLRVLRAGPLGAEDAFLTEVPFVTTSTALGDLDGDGVLDVVVAGLAHISVARGRGDATFEPFEAVELPEYALTREPTTGKRVLRSVTTGDLDGDGLSEIAAVVQTPGSADSDSRFDVIGIHAPFTGPIARTVLTDRRIGWGLAAGDLNEDAVDDLFTQLSDSAGAYDQLILLSDP